MLLQSKDACKNRFWLVEDDLKRGTAVRADKSGKAILTILRHLGRLQEVHLAAGSDGNYKLQSLTLWLFCRSGYILKAKDKQLLFLSETVFKETSTC